MPQCRAVVTGLPKLYKLKSNSSVNGRKNPMRLVQDKDFEYNRLNKVYVPEMF